VLFLNILTSNSFLVIWNDPSSSDSIVSPFYSSTLLSPLTF